LSIRTANNFIETLLELSIVNVVKGFKDRCITIAWNLLGFASILLALTQAMALTEHSSRAFFMTLTSP
jgi:hypothetical protein